MCNELRVMSIQTPEGDENACQEKGPPARFKGLIARHVAACVGGLGEPDVQGYALPEGERI